MTTENLGPQLALQQGAIYEDKAKNVVRLVSIDSNYCAYVVLTNSRSQMHGMITGFSKRGSFQSRFAWVANSEADWVSKSKSAGGEDELSRIQKRGQGAYQVA